MKVLTLLGTRPELIKLSQIIKKLDERTEHIFVHTGQNHDYELNEIFYGDLQLRKPDYYLDVVGDTLGETIGNVMESFHSVLVKEKPDAVVVLGDTNSAIGALMAKKLKIPVFHLEAGNRCFDDNVPEEINRRLLDHISDVNLVYTANQRAYLLSEGLPKDRTFVMGSPMKEVLKNIEHGATNALKEVGVTKNDYYLVNIHRDENCEIPENLDILLDTLETLAVKHPVIVSAHPRLRNKLEGRDAIPGVTFLKPFGLRDYLTLQQNAKCVISDSGTISEESSLLKFPAVTIRNAIERPEAVDVGSILMTGVDKKSILECVETVQAPTQIPADYNVDNCSERVVRIIQGYTPYINKYVYHKR